MIPRLALIAIALVWVIGCAPTRVSLPISATAAKEHLAQLNALGDADQVRVRSRQRGGYLLTIEHRDPLAAVKSVTNRSEVSIQPLSLASSEVAMRSDRLGWLWTWRNRELEEALISELRRRAYQTAEAREQEQNE